MANIYINNVDRQLLIDIKNKLDNSTEIDFITRLLEQEEKSRLHYNKISNIIKKQKRASNKNYARSKKEISKGVIL